MTEQKRIRILSILLILSGFLLGSALPEVFRMNSGTYAGFFSMYSFQKYNQTTVNVWNIFPYIVTSRIQPLLFLWMSGFTAAGLLFHAIYFWWLAAAAGMLLALFVLREGYHGFVLFFCTLLPQWILYTTMWKREVHDMFIRNRGMDAFGHGYGKELRKLGQICMLCVAGSVVEAFLGTWILKKILQIL